MLLVIVGAGASYDCSPLEEYNKPHLAKDLFDEREINLRAMQNYPVVRPIISELRDLVKQGTSSIEVELARVTKEAEHNDAKKRQLMALRFYLLSIIQEASNTVLNRNGGITSYVPLINELQRWQNTQDEPVCIVNFNYDRLLEQALNDAGINWKVTEFGDYIKRDDFLLIKPHGSVDWDRLVLNPYIDKPYDAIENAANIKLEDTQLHIQYVGVDGPYITIPALAVPVIGKYSFECPQPLLDKLDELMPRVSKVMTIGWRAAEEHFQPILQKIGNPVDIAIVTASEAGSGEVLSNLRYLKIKGTVQYNQGFTNFIKSDIFSKFLAL